MLYRTCFALAPVLNWVLLMQANLSCMHVAVKLLNNKGGGNFDRGAYQCQLLK